jgi:hypothetical protein
LVFEAGNVKSVETVRARGFAAAAITGRDIEATCIVAAIYACYEHKHADGLKEIPIRAFDGARLQIVGLCFDVAIVVPSAANLAVVLAIDCDVGLAVALVVRWLGQAVDFGHTHIAYTGDGKGVFARLWRVVFFAAGGGGQEEDKEDGEEFHRYEIRVMRRKRPHRA